MLAAALPSLEGTCRVVPSIRTGCQSQTDAQKGTKEVRTNGLTIVNVIVLPCFTVILQSLIIGQVGIPARELVSKGVHQLAPGVPPLCFSAWWVSNIVIYRCCALCPVFVDWHTDGRA